jgi:hypothetical protein
MARRGNTDVVTNSQEPHGQDMDAVVMVECSQIRDECHLKDLIDLGGAEDWRLVCRGIRGAASISSSINIPDHIHNLCYRYVILVLSHLVYY